MLKQYGPDAFNRLKKRYHNKSIVDLVLNREELDTIRVSGDRFVQLSDPVFQAPDSAWGRARFLAGEKRLGAFVVNTYLFNLGIIWIMTALLCITLYYKTLKRILENRRVIKFTQRLSKRMEAVVKNTFHIFAQRTLPQKNS